MFLKSRNKQFSTDQRFCLATGKWHNSDGVAQVATAVTNAVVNQSTYIPGGCPVTDARLKVDPPRPKHLTDLTITFRPGMHLNPYDNITVVSTHQVTLLLQRSTHNLKTYISLFARPIDSRRFHFRQRFRCSRVRLLVEPRPRHFHRRFSVTTALACGLSSARQMLAIH